MANFFMSVTGDYDTFSKDPDNVGTSTTAGDKVELRVDQALTHRQILNVLERFERWIKQGGLNGAGANLPPLKG